MNDQDVQDFGNRIREAVAGIFREYGCTIDATRLICMSVDYREDFDGRAIDLNLEMRLYTDDFPRPPVVESLDERKI